MNARLMLLASSLTLLGCSTTVPRDVLIAEQRRIEGAVKPGTSVQEAAQSLASLGYTCREAAVDAARKLTVTDCVKPVQDKTEFHVCLRRTGSEDKEISYGLRPLCGR